MVEEEGDEVDTIDAWMWLQTAKWKMTDATQEKKKVITSLFASPPLLN